MTHVAKECFAFYVMMKKVELTRRNAKYYTVLAILIAAGLTIFPDSGHLFSNHGFIKEHLVDLIW